MRATSRRTRPLAAWLLSFGAVALLLLLPGAARAATGVSLDPPKATAKATSLVTFAGRAGAKGNRQVTIQRRSGGTWRTIAKGRTGAKGRFALTWITPSRKSSVVVRARLGARSSKIRRLRVLAPTKASKKIRVSPRTRVISASTVRSVPDPGQPGKLVYAGGNDAAEGQIIAIGRGEETPEGFLGRVTDVERKDGQVVVSTVPAKLTQAVPEGEMRLVAQTVRAAQARPRALGRATCQGSVAASITHDVSFSAGLTVDGSWTLRGGLQSASITASASFNASVKAAIEAAGSCSLPRQTLLKVRGPSFSGFVGPVPVVMTSSLSVYLDATAGAQASLSTGASAGFDAAAGIAWTKRGGFQPIARFTPKFTFDPPALSATANVAANVTPTVNVSLYGIVGPQVALRTGLDFSADAAGDPWWTLSVPVDVNASIAIPPLGLTSPELNLFRRSYIIADAGGPFGTPTPPPGPPPVADNKPDPVSVLAGGNYHTCAVRPNATVACWGDDGAAQLGNAASADSTTPTPVAGISDATGVSAGSEHSCALRVQGQVLCWGSDGEGALGNGAAGASQTPTPVVGLNPATQISSDGTSSCAVLTTRRVACWGGGYAGGTASEVGTIANATQVTAGINHACARRSTGAVACWGEDTVGQLGNGPAGSDGSTPVAVSGITNAKQVSVGAQHSCAVLDTGAVMCWGDNSLGQLGNGLGAGPSDVPVAVTGITDATSLETGSGHTCARLKSGGVRCWGFGTKGQLGYGDTGNRPTPQAVSGLTDAAAVTGGLQHSCAVRATGALVCWGWNSDGQLGNGATGNGGDAANRTTPVAVVGFP